MPGRTDLGRAAAFLGDDRPAHRLRLDQGAAEAAARAAGRDHDVGQHVGRRHVLDMRADLHACRAGRPARSGAPAPSRTAVLVSPDPSSRQNTSSRPSCLIAWISVSRPGSSRAAQITTWAPSGTPQLGRQPDQPLGAHRRGIEAVEVDAGPDGLDPLGEHRHVGDRIPGDVVGHRDQRVGARLALLDQARDPRRADERRVQGGDALGLEPSRHRAADPGGDRRARLHDVDAVVAHARRTAAPAARAAPIRGCRRRRSRRAWRATAAAAGSACRRPRRPWRCRRRRARPGRYRAWCGTGCRRRGTARSEAGAEATRLWHVTRHG